MYLSLGLHKERPSYRRGHPTLSKIFSFCGSFLPTWIRIRIPNPDPLTRLNPDPIGSGSATLVCGAGNTSESESEDGEDDDNCQTLTDIASGYTVATITGDFFGDAELAGESLLMLRIRILRIRI